MDPSFEDAGVGCVRRRFCGEGSMTQDSGMCNLGHLGVFSICKCTRMIKFPASTIKTSLVSHVPPSSHARP